ncbi:MAG: hypothetical protein AAGE94_11305 [Acidobacteriota bacterium]
MFIASKILSKVVRLHRKRFSTIERRRAVLAILVLISVFGSPLVAGETDDVEVGPGSDARATVLSTGESIIVFEADDADGDGVFAGRYDSAGSLIGSVFLVHDDPIGDQDEPDVVGLPNGDFVVVWRADGAAGASTIEARRFSATAVPLGPQARVDSGLGTASDPRVGADASARFTVVWIEAGGLAHRRFASDGAPLDSELVITTSGGAEDPALGVLDSGEQLAVWVDGADIFARRVDASGMFGGAAFLVNPPTIWERSEPSVTPTGDGAFLVAYSSEGQDGSGSGIFVRRVEQVAVGDEFQVNAVTFDEQSQPSLDIETGGKILITWQSEGNADGDSAGIFGSFLRPTGQPICPDAAINTVAAAAQRVSSVAGGDGRFLVTWQTEAAIPMPGQTPDLRARIVLPPLFIDNFESGNLEAWSSSTAARSPGQN